MSVSRVITSLSFATLGLIFAAVSMWSLTVSVNHALWGAFREAAIAASVGFFVLYPLIVVLWPARRRPLVAWLSHGPVARAVSVVLAAFALGVAAAALGFVIWERPGLAQGSYGIAMALVAVVIVLLVVTTFVVPGFAYEPYRAAEDDDWYYERDRWSLSQTFGFLDIEDRIEPGRLHILMAEIGAIGFFGLSALGWYGWRYAPILPSPEAKAWVSAYGLWISLGVFVALALTVALYPAATGRWFRSYRVGFKLALMAMMVVPALLTPMALTRGLPSLTADWVGKEVGAAEVVTIAPDETRRICERAALAMPVDRPGEEVRICAIPADIWDSLKPGDFLLLTGWETKWGLRYLSYTVND